MILRGCGEGWVGRRLGDLARVVQRSRKAGATHIGWS
jgi:hypothetical protein